MNQKAIDVEKSRSVKEIKSELEKVSEYWGIVFSGKRAVKIQPSVTDMKNIKKKRRIDSDDFRVNTDDESLS